MNYSADQTVHKDDVVETVARVCAEKYERYFRHRRARHPRTTVDILARGIGAAIGAKLTISVNEKTDGKLYIKNFIGNSAVHIIVN